MLADSCHTVSDRFGQLQVTVLVKLFPCNTATPGHYTVTQWASGPLSSMAMAMANGYGYGYIMAVSSNGNGKANATGAEPPESNKQVTVTVTLP